MAFELKFVQDVQNVQPLFFEIPKGHEVVEWRSVQTVTDNLVQSSKVQVFNVVLQRVQIVQAVQVCATIAGLKRSLFGS